MKTVPRVDDLHPDGVRFEVAWGDMQVGMSVFLPCVNTEEANKQIAKIAKKNGWKLHTQARIEDERFGLRIWRTV